MLYVLGELPQWLISIIRELGEEITRVENCNTPSRSIIISVNGSCRAKGSIVLTLVPQVGSITIQRTTARGVLKTALGLLRNVHNTNSMTEALMALGFMETKVVSLAGATEVTLNAQVVPGRIYTLVTYTRDHEDHGNYRAVLGRGTTRNTLIIDSSVNWLLGLAENLYITNGDLVPELLILSSIFDAALEFPNPPY